MSPGSPEAGRRAGPAGAGPSGEDELWDAVADPSRRKVLDIILARGEATPTMVAAELPVTRQAVAKHLAVLARAGLVEARRQGRETRYTVRMERLNEAAQVVAQAAARWDRQLVMIKRLAEARARATPAQPRGQL